MADVQGIYGDGGNRTRARCLPKFPVCDQGISVTADRGPVERALDAVARGLAYGYPSCCVEEFALDVLAGRHPGLRRGSVPLGCRGAVYVPCSACCEQLGREVAA